MELKKYNNKRVKVIDKENQSFSGICLFEDKQTFDEDFDALSIKSGARWIKIFDNEIKEIEILDQDYYGKEKNWKAEPNSILNSIDNPQGLRIVHRETTKGAYIEPLAQKGYEKQREFLIADGCNLELIFEDEINIYVVKKEAENG